MRCAVDRWRWWCCSCWCRKDRTRAEEAAEDPTVAVERLLVLLGDNPPAWCPMLLPAGDTGSADATRWPSLCTRTRRRDMRLRNSGELADGEPTMPRRAGVVGDVERAEERRERLGGVLRTCALLLRLRVTTALLLLLLPLRCLRAFRVSRRSPRAWPLPLPLLVALRLPLLPVVVAAVRCGVVVAAAGDFVAFAAGEAALRSWRGARRRLDLDLRANSWVTFVSGVSGAFSECSESLGGGGAKQPQSLGGLG